VLRVIAPLALALAGLAATAAAGTDEKPASTDEKQASTDEKHVNAIDQQLEEARYEGALTRLRIVQAEYSVSQVHQDEAAIRRLDREVDGILHDAIAAAQDGGVVGRQDLAAIEPTRPRSGADTAVSALTAPPHSNPQDAQSLEQIRGEYARLAGRLDRQALATKSSIIDSLVQRAGGEPGGGARIPEPGRGGPPNSTSSVLGPPPASPDTGRAGGSTQLPSTQLP